MRTLLLVAFGLLLSVSALTAQDNYYWIKFRDKNFNAHSLQYPNQFLSAAALERRSTQNIPVDETDLPVSQTYIDSITPYISSLKHRLKWFNMVVVQINNPNNLNAILAMTFVDTLGGIESPPTGKTTVDNKVEEVLPVVDQNYVYPNAYGIAYRQANMLNTDLLHQLGYKGQDVIMAVMDNGFNNVNNIKGFDSVRSQILATWDFVRNEEDVYSGGGHGTNTFSCIAGNIPGKFLGTAPKAQYYLLESEETGREWVMEEYNWAAAAEWADSAGAKIFSTSLGYTTFDSDSGNHTYADMNGHTTVIARAGNMAFAKGILVINSAGNEGAGSWKYISTPADGDSVMAIGAVDSAEVLASFSGRGPTPDGRIKPDVCAQGVKSGVLTVGGDIGTSAGTSFSCPILAGSAASLWSAFPDKTNREVFDAIVMSSPTFWQPDNDYGYGIPNFYTAYWLLKTNYNENVLQVTDNVKFYPNPFSTDLTLVLYGGSKDETRLIEVFDMAGSKVLEKQVYMRDHTFHMFTPEELNNLAAGKYVLRLDRDKKNSHVLIKKN